MATGNNEIKTTVMLFTGIVTVAAVALAGLCLWLHSSYNTSNRAYLSVTTTEVIEIDKHEYVLAVGSGIIHKENCKCKPWMDSGL